MAIILPKAERSNFGSLVGGSVGSNLSQGFLQAIQSKQESKRNALAQEANEERELRKMQIEHALKGKQQQELERMKQEGKRQILGEKQDYLNRLLNQNTSQNGDEKSRQQKSGLDAANIPDEVIAQASAIDPNMGRALGHAKDVALREKREQEKMSPEFQRQQHLESSQAQADVKYNQSLQEASKQHELKEQTLDRLEKLNFKGVTGKPYEKLLEKFGLVALTSEGRREFAADVKNLITDIRSILGGQFSNFEFQTILNAYPSADFSKEANSAIIKNLKGFQDIKKKEVEFAQQLKKENKGKIPYDFQSQVNEMVREYAQAKIPEIKENTREIMNAEYGIPKGYTLMFAPDGEPLSVSQNDVAKYLDLGASLP